jgi:diaminohydroxyphosphoribosylaminopyrimidine deaminase / 5-amino-6-(5-phosphoribosylamino)uracil reductase
VRRTNRVARMVNPAPDEQEDWARLLRGEVAGRGPLVERYGALVAAGSRLVLAQLGQSLDGFIASRTGDARFVTGPEDRRHLHRLRALVDAVVVGVSTVIADDPELTVRDAEGPNPTRVVLDPSGRAPRDARVFTDATAPTLWVVGEQVETSATGLHRPSGAGVTVKLLRLGDPGRAGFDPPAVLEMLARLGLGRVLIEGGGITVSRFLAAGVIDRLWITTAPMLIGDGVPGLRFEGRDRLGDALRAPSRRFVLGEDVCVELDLR